jgi:hypothetical protein
VRVLAGEARAPGIVPLASKWACIDGALTVVKASPESYQELCCVKGLVPKGKGTWTVPTLYGGKLYYRTNDEVLCIDVR